MFSLDDYTRAIQELDALLEKLGWERPHSGRAGAYRMDGSRYDEPTAMRDWALDLADIRGRTIRKEDLANGLHVSTVWLGLNHRFGDGPPLIFETMVFAPNGNPVARRRYSTIEEAFAGHEDVKRDVESWTPEQIDKAAEF